VKKIILLFSVIFFCAFTTQQKQKIIEHAKWQSTQNVVYDGRYISISYPNGDVPSNIGVCTDVIIRAYRSIGVDLQQLIHEDMLKSRSYYNKKYFTKNLDKSIDHRRTQNIQSFLNRKNASVNITKNEKDYLPGDIVFWNIANGHVGIVIDKKVPHSNRYYMVHNIGNGPEIEDFLFKAPIVDHFRW
jgi:uncharacterized protein YijF (DUF1287 family)